MATWSIPRAHPKMGVNPPIPLVAIRPQSVPVTLSGITDGVTHSSFTLHSLLAVVRSGLRPSLVRGDSPRNAPLPMPDRRGQLARSRQRLPFEPPRPTAGAGLVPAQCLPMNGRQTVSATAVMNSPPDRLHLKYELRPIPSAPTTRAIWATERPTPSQSRPPFL